MSLYQIMKSNALEAKRLTGKPAQTSASWYKGDVPTANEALAEIYRISRTDPDAANNLYEAFSAERDMPSSPFYNPHTKATNDSALKIISSYGIDTSGGAKKVLDDNAWLLNYATYSPTTGAITQGKSKESKAAYWYAQINDAESLTQSAEQEWAALQDEIAYWASRDDKNLTDEEILQRIDFSKYKTLAKLDESKANASPELLNRPIGYSRDNLYGAIWAARNGRSTGNPEIDSIYYTIGEGNSYKPNLGVRNYLDASKPTYDPYRVGSTMDSETYQFRTSGFDDKWLQENAGLRADEKYKTEYERIYNAEQNTKAIEQEIKGGYTIKGDGIFTEDTVVPSVQEYINTLSTDALWGRMTYDDVLSDFKKKYPGVYDLASGIPAGNIYNTTRKIDFDFAGLFAKLKNKVDVLNARKNAPTSPDARDTASKAEADANISATGTATVPPEDTAPKSKTGGENLWDMIWNGVTNWMAPGFKDFVEFATQTDTDAVKPSDTEPDKSSKLTLDKSMRMAGTGASDIGQSAEAYSLAELNQQLVTANTQLEAAKVEYNRTRNPIDYEAAQSKVEALKKQIADYGKADMQKAKDAENKAKLDKYNAIKVPDKYGDRSYQDFKDTPDVYERSTRNMGKQEYVQPTYDKWIKLSWFEPKIASTMTETEIDRLEYLYELDPEKARGYYEALSQTELNTRYRAKLEGEAYATGKKDPVYATLYNLVNSIFKGTAGVFNILDGWFNGEIELNDPRFASVWESESTQRGVTEDMGSTGKFLYGVGMSIGENVIGRALLGPYALVTMAGSAANASYSNAIDRGVPQKDALLYGTIVGGLEAATERLQFKYFEKILKTGGREGIKGFFTGLAQSMLQEGSEEIASEIGGFLADTVIAKDKALILDAYAENLKIANGNEQEAWAATVKGFFSDVAMAGVGGAVSGGFFELVGRAGHRIKSDIIKSAQVEGSANTRHATRESRVETKPVATPQEVLAEVVQSTQAAPNTQESALRQEIQTELQHIRDLKNARGEMDEQARLAELDAAAKRNQERLVRLQGMHQSKQAGSQAQRENESEMAAQSRVAQQSTRAASQSGTAQEQAAGREYTQEAQRLGAVESDARVAQAKSESESRMAEHNEQASAEETAADGGDVRQNVETIKRKVSDLQMSTDALEREMAPDAQPAQQEEIALDTKVRATFNIDNGAFSRLFAFVEGSSKTDKSDVQTVAGIAKSISEMPSDTALRIVKSYIESNASLEDAEAMAKVLLFAKAINPDADLASADALIKAALVDRTSAMVASQPIPSDMYLGTTATVIATTGKNATSIALERWGTPGLLYIAKLANSPNEKVRRLAFVLQTMDPSSKSVIVAEEQMKTQTSLTSEQEQAQIDAYNEDRRNPVIMADAKKRALNQAVRIREAELMSENFIDNFKSKADEKVSYAKSQLNESQKMLESAQSELDAINDAIKQVNSGEGTVPSDNEFKKALVGKQLDAILKVELGKMAVEIANINVKSAENDANNWKEDSQLALSARALSDVLERANAAFYKWMDTYRRAYKASKALAQAQQATSAVVEQIVNNVPVDPKALESATAAESDAMQAQLKAKQDADKAKADAATAAEEVSKAETAARAKEEAARAQVRAQAEQEVRQRTAEALQKQNEEAAKAAETERLAKEAENAEERESIQNEPEFASEQAPDTDADIASEVEAVFADRTDTEKAAAARKIKARLAEELQLQTDKRSGSVPDNADFIKKVSKKYRVTFQYDTNMKIDEEARVEGRTIYINPNASVGTAVKGVVMHEITHPAEQSEGYKAYSDSALKIKYKGDTEQLAKDVQAKIARYARNGITLTEQEAQNEIVAQITREVIFADEESMARFAQEDPGFIRQVLQHLKDTWESLKSMFSDSDMADIIKARRMLEKALANDTLNKAGEIKYAISTDKSKQAITSADTSINSSKLPVLFTEAGRKGLFKDGTVNLDIGGGRFNNATEYLQGLGVTSYVYDPYNRTAEYNANSASKTENHQSDTVTISNVLNVIAEEDARGDVYRNAIDALKPNGSAYITVYEGDGTGIGRETSKGYQLNQKTADYVKEVLQYFENVKLNGKLIIASNPKSDTTVSAEKFSLKEQDAAYLQAVESGDMETARKMVDEAAKTAMLNSKIRDVDGKLIAVYHGTDANFNVFDRNKSRANMDIQGNFFTPWKEDAEGYGRNVRKLYLNITNPATESIGYKALRQFQGQNNAGVKARDYLIRLGYDGVDNSGEEYIMFDSAQAKSADPVTYSDTGSVIPLSERFNTKSNDIRYSLTPDDDAEIEAVVQRLLTKYGAIKRGETPVNDIRVPKRDALGQKVGQGTRTILESGAIRDKAIASMKQGVIDGDFSYTPVTDKSSIEFANGVIGQGIDNAKAAWSEAFAGNKPVTKDQMAVGFALLNEYSKNKDTANVLDTATELVMAGVRAGQSVQSYRLLKKMTSAAKIMYAQKVAIKLQNELEGKGIKGVDIKLNQGLVEDLINAKGDKAQEDALDAVMQDLQRQMPPNWRSRLDGWRMIAMLCNPKTWIRNKIGNMIFLPAVKIKNAIAATVETALASKLDTRTKALKVDAKYKDFAGKDLESVQKLLRGGGKYNPTSRYAEGRHSFNSKALQGTLDFTSRMMETGFFGDAKYLNAYYVHALSGYMQANNYDLNNITPEQLDAARDYAVKEAKKNTYRAESKFASRLAQISNDSVFGYIAVEGVIPFKKTPINILKNGIEYSPLGLIDTMFHQLPLLTKGKITGAQFIDKISANLSGTMLTAAGAFLASLGCIKAGFKPKDEEDEFGQLTGEQEYAMEIDIFGNKFSYTLDWAAPSALPFFVGVALNQMYNSDEDGVTLESIWDSVLGITEPAFNLTMLQGVSSIVKSASYGDENAMASLGLKAASNYTSQFIPTIAGQIARTIDPNRRQVYADQNTGVPDALMYIYETIQNKIPFWSQSNQPYMNAWGELDKNDSLLGRFLENFVSPGYYSGIDVDEAEQYIKDIYAATSDESVFIDNAGKSYDIDKKTIKLTSEQYTELVKERGTIAHDLVTQLAGNPDLAKLDKKYVAQAIADAYNYATQMAKSKVTPEYKTETWMLSASKNNPVKSIVQRQKNAVVTDYRNACKEQFYTAFESNDAESTRMAIKALYDSIHEEDPEKTSLTILSQIRSNLNTKYKAEFLEYYTANDMDSARELASELGRLGIGYDNDTFVGWINSYLKEQQNN